MTRLAPNAAIGLTGGIGSGKSTVAALLVELGAHLVDTDAIARSLTAPGGGAMPAVEQVFGPDFVAPDGALDRARMRERAFADAGAKAQLEALLHPLIGAEAQRQAALAAGRPVVFDVPLLTPTSAWRARVARILVVDCSEAAQAHRVAQRPGWSDALARSVIAQQLPRAQRRALADAVIHNDGIGLDALRAEAQALWHLWFGAEPG
jgi:dephospho-CoA kinase